MASILTMMKLSVVMLSKRLIHFYRPADDQTDDENVEGKVVIVTGGNTGIGRSVVITLVKRGAEVVMACRDVVKGQKLLNEVKEQFPHSRLVMIKLDLSDLASVRDCAEKICVKFKKIHMLINNAGYMGNHPMERVEGSSFEKHLVTNHLGHFLLTLLLLKKMDHNGSPSRIINVGSTAMDMADLNLEDLNMEVDTKLGFLNMRPYANSKLCMFLCTKELAKKLHNTQIKTYYLCPGAVNTSLTAHWSGFTGTVARFLSNYVTVSEEQGTETILYCALSKDTASESGKPYHYRKYWSSADQKFDAEVAATVWTLSENFVGLKFTDVFSK